MVMTPHEPWSPDEILLFTALRKAYQMVWVRFDNTCNRMWPGTRRSILNSICKTDTAQLHVLDSGSKHELVAIVSSNYFTNKEM